MARSVHGEQVEMLKKFVKNFKSDPNILYREELSFFKEFLEEELKAQIPPKTEDSAKTSGPDTSTIEVEEEDSGEPGLEEPCLDEEDPPLEEEEEQIVESDVELDDSGVIEDGDEDMPECGDDNLEVTEDMEEQAGHKKSEAMNAFGEGRLEDAIDLFTQAIKLHPTSALMYGKRANVYLDMKKPKKAIHDCNKAIELNSNFAKGYQWRGKARKMLGQWEEAFQDLTQANKLDCDEDAIKMLSEVTPNAKKMEEHRKKYEKIREEKKSELRKAKEDYERQKAEHPETHTSGVFAGVPGASTGSAGGMPGMPDVSHLMNDEFLLSQFQDPEVSEALQDVAMNPANISNYKKNPKVQAVIDKMANMLSGGHGGLKVFPQEAGSTQ